MISDETVLIDIQDPFEVNIYSGNGLLLSDHKPSLEPVLANIHDIIWHNGSTVH